MNRSSSNGLDLGAVLLTLAAALRLLVVVEFVRDAVGGAVEDVDGRPEQGLEIGLEAGIAERGDEGRRRCRRWPLRAGCVREKRIFYKPR
jgi:hypothetical protein